MRGGEGTHAQGDRRATSRERYIAVSLQQGGHPLATGDLYDPASPGATRKAEEDGMSGLVLAIAQVLSRGVCATLFRYLSLRKVVTSKSVSPSAGSAPGEGRIPEVRGKRSGEQPV